MQEFLESNKVTCNLISLTGYRTLVILHALLNEPKSADELNEILYNNQYIKEKFSIDTLRLYLNSLRKVNCDIPKAHKKNGNKYSIISSPFELNISDAEYKALKNLISFISDKIEISELLKIEEFLLKISQNSSSEKTKNLINKLLIINKIDLDLFKELDFHCRNKNKLKILYNSPISNKKYLEILSDKLVVKENRLYLYGYIQEYNEYSKLSVSRILSVNEIKINIHYEEIEEQTVICELKDMDYYPKQNEEIISADGNKLIIKINSKNEFETIQRIMSFKDKCKILSPENLKEKIKKEFELTLKAYD
ncbi:MAG: WYL domain-containing protein [bacterium]|nr:WYL domain-containing protein [bacterium]